MRIVAVIQARMGSTRLPGKVLADLAGRPVLARVVERARRAPALREVVVATTERPEDDAVVALCATLDVPCIRGSTNDVLDRYRVAAAACEAEHLARLTADCPLLDPAVVETVAAGYAGGGYDYVSNLEPPTFPHGLDVELLSRDALERAWSDATAPEEREHVTLHIRRRRGPGGFRCATVRHDRDRSAHRWTVDESRDLAFARAVYERLGDAPFGMAEVLALLEAEPALGAINAPDASRRRTLHADGTVR